MYEPKPIATAQVQLPQNITALIERLAENNHDIGAQQYERRLDLWPAARRRCQEASRPGVGG
jgi:hypothetical protein